NTNYIINKVSNGHTLHFGNDDPVVDGKLQYGGVKDLTIEFNGNMNPTAGSAIYINRYIHFKVENVQIREGVVGINIVGDGQVKISNCEMAFGNLQTSLQAGSAGIKLRRSQVASDDPNAIQDAADSLYYTEPNSVYISDTNIREFHATQYGYENGISVEAVDGLYLDNLHIDGGDNAA
ncbi:unnamed protein product, partial [marine sediment metagenome]